MVGRYSIPLIPYIREAFHGEHFYGGMLEIGGDFSFDGINAGAFEGEVLQEVGEVYSVEKMSCWVYPGSEMHDLVFDSGYWFAADEIAEYAHNAVGVAQEFAGLYAALTFIGFEEVEGGLQGEAEEFDFVESLVEGAFCQLGELKNFGFPVKQPPARTGLVLGLQVGIFFPDQFVFVFSGKPKSAYADEDVKLF